MSQKGPQSNRGETTSGRTPRKVEDPETGAREVRWSTPEESTSPVSNDK